MAEPARPAVAAAASNAGNNLLDLKTSLKTTDNSLNTNQQHVQQIQQHQQPSSVLDLLQPQPKQSDVGEAEVAQPLIFGSSRSKSSTNDGNLHEVVKRKYSHSSLGCRGVFHKAMFAELESVCDDCYEIYKIPEVHQLCR